MYHFATSWNPSTWDLKERKQQQLSTFLKSKKKQSEFREESKV